MDFEISFDNSNAATDNAGPEDLELLGATRMSGARGRGWDWPSDDLAFIRRLGALRPAEWAEVYDSADSTAALSRMKLLEDKSPVAAVLARMDVSNGTIAKGTALSKYHPISRLVVSQSIGINDIRDLLKGWPSEVMPLSATLAIYTRCIALAGDMEHWHVEPATLSKIEAEVNEMVAAGVTNTDAIASFRQEVSRTDVYVSSYLAHELIRGVKGAVWNPQTMTLTYGAATCKVYKCGLMAEEDFPKLIAELAQPGINVTGVTMVFEDAAAIGFLTASMRYSNANGVTLIQYNGSAYRGPFVAPSVDKLRVELVESFSQAAKLLGSLPYAKAAGDYHVYVAHVYAWMLATKHYVPDWNGRWAPLDIKGRLSGAIGVEVPRILAIEVDAMSHSSRSTASRGAMEYNRIPLTLAKASEMLQKRRDKFHDQAQAVARHLDIGKDCFGEEFSDGFSDFYNSVRLVKGMTTSGARVDVFGVDASFPPKAVRQLLPDAELRMFFVGARPKIKGADDLLQLNPASGPLPEGRGDFALDLYVGKGQKKEIMTTKTGWLAEYPNVVAIYTPSVSSVMSVAEDGTRQLPFGLRKYWETHKSVVLKSTSRWHQTDFLVIATGPERREFKEGTTTVADVFTRDVIMPFWVPFSYQRSVLSHLGNQWIDWCTTYGLRYAPPFRPEFAPAICFPVLSYHGYRGDDDIAKRFGSKASSEEGLDEYQQMVQASLDMVVGKYVPSEAAKQGASFELDGAEPHRNKRPAGTNPAAPMDSDAPSTSSAPVAETAATAMDVAPSSSSGASAALERLRSALPGGGIGVTRRGN